MKHHLGTQASVSSYLRQQLIPILMPLNSRAGDIGLPLTVQDTKEVMCLAHIYATAGRARVAFSADVHDYGVDGTFKIIRQQGKNHIPSGIPLDYQAKATSGWELEGDHIVYDLEARAYNAIAGRTPDETTMILILLCLPQEIDHWHEATTDTTTLRHCCYWYRVEGGLTENTATAESDTEANLLPRHAASFAGTGTTWAE